MKCYASFFTGLFFFGLTETTVAAVQVTFVGIDDTIAATHRFVLFRAKARTRASFPNGMNTSFVGLTHIQHRMKEKE